MAGLDQPTHLDVGAHNAAQKEQIVGSDNMFFTGLEVGHPPNRHEAIRNWQKTGADQRFRHENKSKFQVPNKEPKKTGKPPGSEGT